MLKQVQLFKKKKKSKQNHDGRLMIYIYDIRRIFFQMRCNKIIRS